MARKGIIFAIIFCIGLGLYVFLVERKKPVSGDRESILKFDKDRAFRLALINGEKTIRLDKDKEGKWQITSPLLTKADDEVVKNMVDDMSDLTSSQSLDVQPSEWGDFGLKKPECEVIVSIDNREEKISFGDKNPNKTSIYTRIRGKDKVYLTSTYLEACFKKDVFDMREKKVLIFDTDKVSGLELLSGNEKISLEKRAEEWHITEPVKDKGDKYEIDSLISGIYDLKASGFIDEPGDDETYGLDMPEVKCIIWIGPEKICQTALFGKTFGEGGKKLQYSRREHLSTIFKVEVDNVDKLKKSAFDLRNKVIFTLDRDKVKTIELIYPEKKFSLRKGKEDKWFLQGKERIEVESDKVNDMLWDLMELKAKGIPEEEIKDPALFGLDKPEVKVIIKSEGVEKAILFGKKCPEGDNVYAQVAGNPRLFLVSSDIPSHLKKDPAELKKAPEEPKGEKEDKK